MKNKITALKELKNAIDNMSCDTSEEINAYKKSVDTFWHTLIELSKTMNCGPFELLALIEK